MRRINKIWTLRQNTKRQGDTQLGIPRASHGNSRLHRAGAPAPDADPAPSEIFTLAWMGKATAAAHQGRLLAMLAMGIVVSILIAGWVLQQADRVAKQLAAAGQALMHSQRLAKSVSQALIGNAAAFAELRESAEALPRNVHALRSGDAGLGVQPVHEAYFDVLRGVTAMADRAQRNARLVGKQEVVLTQTGDALQAIRRQSADLHDAVETIVSLKLLHNAAASEIFSVGQLMMLTQRIARSASDFQSIDSINAEAVFLLGKDLSAFKETAEGLLNGNAELRLQASKDRTTREALQQLQQLHDMQRKYVTEVLGHLQEMASAREAQQSIVKDTEPLRHQLEVLQSQLSSNTGITVGQLVSLTLSCLFVVACGIGISRVQLLDSRARQAVAEVRQQQARQREQEAKRLNDANQAAILRLMNELQSVAEGDLTQEATVTEDITGAIADSVNYTVEELRQLVGNVQSTVIRVAQTTAVVDQTSTQLLTTATAQLHEIRETGEAVLKMATRINAVSGQAQTSAQVAQQSLEAADTGLQAVQNTIGGMNAIRDQIQNTAKRIKRLGESSQEIGEITELISDITEQTNVLALNAAIQAASAGEFGRGFSVVAEEVQRLAERSADATRQIASLVNAIQVDTQDAVAAMERSTQGVVEGAQLTDSAGMALSEIDRVSRQLAELIEHISRAAQREASLANELAASIHHIFVVTEQTGQGTRMTAQQVRELSRMASELHQSISRFKIS